MVVVFRRPYYAWSQYVVGEEDTACCSSIEFYRWFDDQLTREERDLINYALNGPAHKSVIAQIVTLRRDAWEKSKKEQQCLNNLRNT